MTVNFKICCFIAVVSAATTLACEKKDGVFVISPHLKNDSEIIDAVKNSEALAKRKDWKAAALEIKKAEKESKCEELSCCEECGLILKCAYLTYLFNARHDDLEIPLKAEEALSEYTARYGEEFSRNYAELYVLLMAYYWSLNDTASHDEVLKKLALYNKDSVYYFVTLLYACLERPRHARDMKAFLDEYKGMKGTHYELAIAFYGGLSDDEKKAAILSWLKNNANVDLFIMRCFTAHVASVLDVRDRAFIVAYDSALLEWLKAQEDKEERKEAFALALSEHYRIAAILPK